MKGDADDPKALIREAYRIDGIGIEECRSIFLDWALSLPDGTAPSSVIERLLARHAADAPDHPMTEVLRAGLAQAPRPGRRGGASGRRA